VISYEPPEKEPGITQAQIETLLEENSQGKKWKKLSHPKVERDTVDSSHGIPHAAPAHEIEWKRDDGGDATYSPTDKTLIILSREGLKSSMSPKIVDKDENAKQKAKEKKAIEGF
jgi:hypothetical protein